MIKKILILIILHLSFFKVSFGQERYYADTSNFNYSYWNGVADKRHIIGEERLLFIASQKKLYFEELNHVHVKENELVWVSEPAQKGIGSNAINAGPCTNIDFESGTMAGWVRSTGFNPLFNATGCCPNPNGDQTIMTGAGLDPFGGFPVVYPLAGNFSLRLGSTATGGIADRVSQTFFVTPSNANFTYRYAVVLNDPLPGVGTPHQPAEKPRFESEIVDTLGNPIQCTSYSVVAGAGIAGFTTSATQLNNAAIRCKTWTDVAIDLSPHIGQNVTIRFTVYDCGPSGHFAYAYLDGLCTNFATSVADTTCANIPHQMCAPSGFSTTTWNGPGFVNDPNRCINAVLPGTYSCTTVLIPGCPGPTFVHTLTILPSPVVSFTPVGTGVCASQYTFNSSMSIPSGSIVSYLWSFGDGSTLANSPNPIHNYTTPGTYQVKLRAISNRGCMDSLITPVTIFPVPVLAFSPPSNCINTVVQFTNTSNITLGSITGYTWNLGNGATSNLINPTNTYTANGTYTITLTAVSNLGCPATLTQTLGIFPPPIISFSANPLCDINGTSFSPSTSTAIVSGNLVSYFWNFGDGGTSNQANPIHIYAAPGLYTVNFSAISNHNCPASTSNTFIISPSPTIAFSTNSINACTNNFTFTNNSGISSGPISYTWNFGGGVTSTTSNTVIPYSFPGIGNYTVSLIGVSNMGCGDTAVQYISIYPYPVINFSVPASCENAIFTVTTTAVSGSVTSYNWDFGDPGSGAANTSTLQNPTHFYASTNSFVITLNLMSNLNCPSTTITPIVVYPNPVAIFSLSTLNACSLPYTFTNSSTVSAIGASSVVAAKWNFGGVGTSTIVNPGTINFPGNGTYSVSLIAITNHNCSDTMSTIIQIHPKPQLTFSLAPSCENTPVLILSTSSISPVPLPGSSISSYTWNFGDNTFSSLANPSAHTFTTNGTYTVNYSATSDMGCVSNVSHSVVIHPLPVINFTTTSNLCFGNLTQFTSTSSIASAATNTIFSYYWIFGDGATGSNPSTSHSYSTSGSFPVTFSATTNNECSSALTKTVTIHPLANVNFTVNGGCLNTQSQFTESTSIVLGNVTSYTYNFGDGNNSTQQNPAYTYTSFGTFTPTLTVTSNQGCVSSGTKTVTIHPLPNIAFGPPSACVNSIVQFTNSSNVALGSLSSYTWNFGDGGTSNLTNPPHTYTFANTYVATLTATSNQGCVKSGTNNLSIFPYPSVTITPINSSCTYDQVAISPNISITGSNNPISGYTVSFGDGSPTFTSTSIGLTVPHVYTAYNTYTVTVSAISNGCATTTYSTVNIYPKPFPNFVASKFCYTDSMVFVNTSTIAATYSINNHFWFFNNGASTSTLASPKYQFTNPGTFSVTLTEFSYPEPGLTCSLSAVKIITVNPLPGSSFITNTVCQGFPTTFTNTTNSSSVTGWSWYFYNNNVLFSPIQNPIYTYTGSGTFYAKLKSLNVFGCKDSVVNPVVVNPNPVSSFIADSVCFGANTTFTATSTITLSNSISSYSWNFGGGNASVGNMVSYLFPSAGQHTVELTSTSNFGCSNKSTGTVVVYYVPSVTFSATEACFGKPTTFINLSAIPSGSVTGYVWNFGNGTFSTLKNPVITYSASGSYTVKLDALSDHQCLTTKTLNVVVRENPVANFYNTKVVCAGDVIVFNNLSTSADGNITNYYWDFNGDNQVDNITLNPTTTYTTVGPTIIKLEVKTEYGCTHIKSQPVFVNAKAVPVFTSLNNNGCPLLCVKFENLSYIGTGSISAYEWDFGDGNSNNSSASPIHCYGVGVYNVTLTAKSDSGCISKAVQPGFVRVFPLPTAGFKVEPEQIDEDEPFIKVTTNSSDAVFTKYYINDGSTYNTVNFEHTFESIDNTKPMIVQIVKNANGCADTTFKVLEIKPAFSIYFPNVFTPNDDGNNDTYQPKGVGISKFNLWIYDRWGHLLFETTDLYNQWDGRVRGSADPIKQDVYTWKAKVVDVFNKNHEYVGHVTLLR